MYSWILINYNEQQRWDVLLFLLVDLLMLRQYGIAVLDEDKRITTINNQPFSGESNASQRMYFFHSFVFQRPASIVNPEGWSAQSRGPDCSSIISNPATILAKGELTVLPRRPGSALQRTADGSWSEHARNELPVTLRSSSILHEVSSSNKLGIVLRRWLTWPSSRPDTHREMSVATQTTHCHTQLRASNGILTADSNSKQLEFTNVAAFAYAVPTLHAECKQTTSKWFPPLPGREAKVNEFPVSPQCRRIKRRSHAFAWSYISMIADTSHSNHLFPISKRCWAVEPVLRQIRSKHSDRCIHKNGSRGPGVCSDTALNYLSTEQLSRLPFVYPPCCRVGSGAEEVAGNKMRRDEANTQRLWAQTQFLGVTMDERIQKSQKRCLKTVLSNVLQDRPFGLVPYFKYIVLKCDKVSHLNVLIEKRMQTNARKSIWSLSEWLQGITLSSQFFESIYIKPNG